MKKPAWKIAGVLLGACAASVLALWLWTRAVAERKWAAMERSVQEWIAEAGARDALRPVLEGDPVPGNAWDDYELALQEVWKSSPGAAIGDFIDRRPGADRKAAEAILAKHGSALEHWSRGLRRLEGRRAIDWVSMRDSVGEIQLALLAASKAKILLEEGRVSESSDLLLGLGLFARDVGHNGFPHHMDTALTLYRYAVDGLKEVLLTKQVAKADLERIARGLEILDHFYETGGADLLNARTWIGLAFLRHGPTADVLPPHRPKPGWRYAFSTRLMAVNTFETVGQWYARDAASQSMSWSDELKITQQIEAESKASSNPMIQDFYNRYRSDLRSRLAQLRLLRMAAHYLATGEFLRLDDPFGTTLHHSRVGGILKVWSVSINGLDDSGEGDWDDPLPGRLYREDIVLELRP